MGTNVHLHEDGHCAPAWGQIVVPMQVHYDMLEWSHCVVQSLPWHHAVNVCGPSTLLKTIALCDNMSYAEYLLWMDIQDIVGPASSWPPRIRRNFWTRDLSRWQRVLTATFIWVNGLNPEVYYDWCELKSFFRRGSAVHRHFQRLFDYFHQGRRCSLWSWRVLNRRYEWVDGTVCLFLPREWRTRYQSV